jgi:hypothetical protein
MDILNISQDDHESDTSQEDLEDDDGTEGARGREDEVNQDRDQNQIRFNKWSRPKVDWVGGELRFMLMDSDFGIVRTKEISPGLIPFLIPELQGRDGEQSYVRYEFTYK